MYFTTWNWFITAKDNCQWFLLVVLCNKLWSGNWNWRLCVLFMMQGLLLFRLALRVTSCLFRLALRGYSVASLLWASRSHPQSLRSLKIFKKKVSQSTPNGLKRIKMQKNFLPLWRASVAQRAQRAAKCNFTYPCGRFAPSSFALARVSRFAPTNIFEKN